MVSSRILRSCFYVCERHIHGLRFASRQATTNDIEKLLSVGAVEIDFSKYTTAGLLSETCPIKKVYTSQLAAHSPIEDRWNIGLTQVDGIVSSCLFTVLDGHAGTSCVHTLAWSILDYVAAAFLDTNKLHLALNHWRCHGIEQPYHLARRLDLLSSDDHRRLPHVASPPSPQMSAYVRRCLRGYVEDLVNRTERSMDPVQCMSDALLRIDNDLCSAHGCIAPKPQSEESGDPCDPVLVRDLMRVALSGSVGIVGRIFWCDDRGKQTGPTELHLANVGDCGAVLLRQVNYFEDCDPPVFEAIQCTNVHQGSRNKAELDRVTLEHPDNPPDELFRDGGLLLGELAPSRAFGDVKYKWPANQLLHLSQMFNEHFSDHNAFRGSGETSTNMFALPTPYTSPPYLTAKPEVTCFKLTPADRYLILATDGLWDMLSPEETARLMTDQLRKTTSPATHLLWNCLTNVPPAMSHIIALRSSNEKELESTYFARQEINTNRKALNHIFKLLSLPPGFARYYRDDITVMILELTG